MRCRDCPYGIEDYERRMNWYDRIVSERGIPNDIYHSLSPDEAVNEFEKFCWCDKVGGKTYIFGKCSEYGDDITPHTIHRSKKRRNKYERNQKYKDKLKRLYEINGGYYYSPVYHMDSKWIDGYGLVDLPKSYYKRVYRGRNSKYLKRQSNKAIRRYQGELHKGNMAHKLYDYWWKLR